MAGERDDPGKRRPSGQAPHSPRRLVPWPGPIVDGDGDGDGAGDGTGWLRVLAGDGDGPPVEPDDAGSDTEASVADAARDGGTSTGAPGRKARWLRRVPAWGAVAALALWLVVRVTGAGQGTPVETLMVLTPHVALASVVVVALVAALRLWWAAAAAALCCAGFALVLAPVFVPGPHPSPAPRGPHLRVMTANVQFGLADPDVVVRLAREHDIDVLAVQELTPAFHEQLLAAGLDEQLPHRVVDTRYGASGAGLYSRHPAEAVDHPVPGMHANPTVRLRVPGARPVQATVVHPAPPLLDADRAEWARTLAALPRPGDGGTVHLLLGDFNATVDQPTLRDLLGDGYVDAAGAVGKGWQPTWRARGLAPGLAIDHVLVDRFTKADEVTVHGLPGSDHRAVVATLRLPAADDDG